MTRVYREVDELDMPEERDTLPAPPPSELVHTIPAPAPPLSETTKGPDHEQ